MTSPVSRAATQLQIREHVMPCLFDPTDDHSAPASARGLAARTRVEHRLRDAKSADELPALVDTGEPALWADTTAAVDIAFRCLKQSNYWFSSSRHSIQITTLRPVEAPPRLSGSRNHIVLGREYLR